MKILEYLSPEGEIIYHPNIDNLIELIVSSQEDYWCSGSGEGCLTWYEEECTSSIIANKYLCALVLTFSQRYGFYLQHTSNKPERQTYISIGDGDFNHENAIEVYICGDPLLLPSAYFVSTRLACIAVEEFERTGDKTGEVNWCIQGEDTWDYGDPDGFI